MKTLPFRKIEGSEYQDIAESVDDTTLKLLHGMHSLMAAKSGSSDAGPIVTGALSAVVGFIMSGGHGEEAVHRAFADVLATIPQQYALARASAQAGATTGGRA